MINNTSEKKRFYGWTIVVSLWIIYFLNVGFPMYGGQTVNTFMADEMGFKRTSTQSRALCFFVITSHLP